MVEAACQHVGQCIVGLDARQIDFIWTKLYRDMNWLGQAGPLLSAISAVDIALWDIKGKTLGVPVYELLGGAYRVARRSSSTPITGSSTGGTGRKIMPAKRPKRLRGDLRA